MFCFVFGFKGEATNTINNKHLRRRGDGTFFDTSVAKGACGLQHQNNDFIAALSRADFQPSANPNLSGTCGKCALVKRGEKQVLVQIVDICEGCKKGDIDMTPTAFSKIATEQEGRVDIVWDYADCSTQKIEQQPIPIEQSKQPMEQNKQPMEQNKQPESSLNTQLSVSSASRSSLFFL